MYYVTKLNARILLLYVIVRVFYSVNNYDFGYKGV